MNRKDSIPSNCYYPDNKNNNHQLNVKNYLFLDNSNSANSLQFNTIVDPIDNFIENELSFYNLLKPLSQEYEEMQYLLDFLSQPQKQVVIRTALFSAINSGNPRQELQKKLLQYKKMKNSIMMVNDLSVFFGHDKEYTKEFLKFKLKYKHE